MHDQPTETVEAISTKLLSRHWRAANYIAAAQIYLRDNVLLRQPLQPEHIKPRLLGHWGTVPGINFVYTHLNRLICQSGAKILLVTGPGHGAPANLANLWLEGSLGERHSALGRNLDGLKHLIQSFSWPGGFPSHLTPATPGTIHEGGELGYALATSFGAAFDNPDLIVACVVGDGEAETGPTATAWHCNKYLHRQHNGSVLPILHLNGYKIASRSIFGSMSDEELRWLFTGYGYRPIFVSIQPGSDRDALAAHESMGAAMDQSYKMIRGIKCQDDRAKPIWPMIILRSPKGWTVTDRLDGQPIENTHRAHQVPIPDPRGDDDHLAALEAWLRSYRIEELLDDDANPIGDWTDLIPAGDRRMGMLPEATGGQLRRCLDRPDWTSFTLDVQADQRGKKLSSDTKACGRLLAEVIRRNPVSYRIFCPDEMDSNRLGCVFDVTDRQYQRPVPDHDPDVDRSGRVIEMLSEHTCQAWLQGYLLTGRHGLFPCYEAFVSIVDSMMGQYAKFLKRSNEIEWRKPVSSMNYLLSSEGWRQDHNGYSHQMPGFINLLLNKKAEHVRVYLPPDTNCLLSTMDHCLQSTDKINLIIASKQPMPQWLTKQEADQHCRRGISTWDWFGEAVERGKDGEPDVVLACSGVYPTAEAVVARRMLHESVPKLRCRLVNVTDLLILERDTFHPHGLDEETFESYFGKTCPVIFNFHGYPSAVKHLLWNRPNLGRFQINGYQEEGTTTTPFTLLADNGIDRFTLIDQVFQRAASRKSQALSDRKTLRSRFTQQQKRWLTFAQREGRDVDEFTDWSA